MIKRNSTIFFVGHSVLGSMITITSTDIECCVHFGGKKSQKVNHIDCEENILSQTLWFSMDESVIFLQNENDMFECIALFVFIK